MQMDISLNKTESEKLCRMFNNECSHTLIQNKVGYYLIIHGLPCGGVSYNGYITSFEELSTQLRKELNLLDTDELICYVICCYGYKQVSYIDSNTFIASMFTNKNTIELNYTDNNTYCTVSFE